MLLPACSLTLSLSVTSLPASTVGADVGEADTLGAAVGALDVGVALVGVALGALVGADEVVVGADVGENVIVAMCMLLGTDVGLVVGAPDVLVGTRVGELVGALLASVGVLVPDGSSCISS